MNVVDVVVRCMVYAVVVMVRSGSVWCLSGEWCEVWCGGGKCLWWLRCVLLVVVLWCMVNGVVMVVGGGCMVCGN